MCKFFRVALGALFLCHFYSVGLDAETFSKDKNLTKKKWTILVFLNADNNLEDAGYEDLQEMERVGSTDDVNVVVQFDYISPQGTKRIYVEKNTQPAFGGFGNHDIHSKVLEEMPEQDMGDPKVFSDFVTWGMNSFPAEHYMVVMWNHGSGWSKEEEADRGISYDDTSGNHISTNQLESSLDEIVSTTGRRIDVLGFDACLMSMVEVADAMSGLVDYVVASEETIPFDGYPYDDFLNAFNASPDKSKENLIRILVDAYGASYSGGSQGTKQVTLSAIDISKLEMLKRRLDRWVLSLKRAGVPAASFRDAGRNTQSYTYRENKDLGDYVTTVMNTLMTFKFEVQLAVVKDNSNAIGAIGASLALQKAIADTVVANFASPYFAKSTGLAIYLPVSYKFSGTEGDSQWKYDQTKRDLYRNLRWAKTTQWTSYLDDLFLY